MNIAGILLALLALVSIVGGVYLLARFCGFWLKGIRVDGKVLGLSNDGDEDGGDFRWSSTWTCMERTMW